jgi:hypothetical protein
MSRPKQPAGTTLSITAIRMPPQVKVKLEALSFQSGLTQQEHIRRALDAYFDELEKEGKFDPKSKRPANARVMGRPRKVREEQPQPQAAAGPSRRVFRRPGAMGAAA